MTPPAMAGVLDLREGVEAMAGVLDLREGEEGEEGEEGVTAAVGTAKNPGLSKDNEAVPHIDGREGILARYSDR
jgi:hypothetical protein